MPGSVNNSEDPGINVVSYAWVTQYFSTKCV
jgi:hypothetical protein